MKKPHLAKSFSFEWWQVALYEVALISLGIIIGTRWHGLFEERTAILFFLFIIPGGYIWHNWWKQIT